MSGGSLKADTDTSYIFNYPCFFENDNFDDLLIQLIFFIFIIV